MDGIQISALIGNNNTSASPKWGTITPTAVERADVLNGPFAALAARYSDRFFATIDNSDHYANTYQGFGAFFVAGAHARYKINDHLAAGVGITNLGDRSYFLFHPFTQRTVIVDLKYSY